MMRLFLLAALAVASTGVSASSTVQNTLATAQQQTKGHVKGRVLDKDGEPIIGATVTVKGTGQNAVTDIDGNFTIEAPEGATVVVSYIGFQNQEFKANGNEVVVTMNDDSTNLNEVVVTALGIKKEAKSLSYNVQQLNSDAVMTVQDANFVNSLSGKMAGVQINAAASGIGGASRVVMRGAKSIDGNNNVLYVIDGIPVVNAQTGLDENALAYSGNGQTGDATAMLNPDDIESISALTGPSAAALYGSTASNGVILITTKKGAAGRTNITYNGSFQFSNPLMLPEFQNTYGQSEAGSYYSWGDKLTTPSSYDPGYQLY